ncbi:uncharacterized protein LOC119337223 [Triticum dicoccoides]|uniref:uncharacterized protein LOC119337223 n=1 Tax=Triticum dicoccoides TaxID=85692 RepID=UPI000E7B976A|nr:uncharacterized protein LOC119337223 [Triticum dicoccoides]
MGGAESAAVSPNPLSPSLPSSQSPPHPLLLARHICTLPEKAEVVVRASCARNGGGRVLRWCVRARLRRAWLSVVCARAAKGAPGCGVRATEGVMGCGGACVGGARGCGGACGVSAEGGAWCRTQVAGDAAVDLLWKSGGAQSKITVGDERNKGKHKEGEVAPTMNKGPCDGVEPGEGFSCGMFASRRVDGGETDQRFSRVAGDRRDARDDGPFLSKSGPRGTETFLKREAASGC